MSESRRYRVMHRTRYTYDDVVTGSYGRCHLSPRELPGQRVTDAALVIDPEPEDRSTGVDVHGNSDAYFHIRTPHRELSVTSTSTVEVDPIDADLLEAPAATGAWEDASPPRLIAHRGGRFDDETVAGARMAMDYVLDLNPPEITPAVREYAAAIFTPGRPLIEAITDLTTRIFTDFAYKSGSTAVSTRVDTVMQRRTGVCQDFARVAIACLRSQGLAARYVSGYLATEPPPGRERVYGADASHAWAAVWLPDGRWIPFDPTNDKLVDERHVTVAWGRDYDDVPPLRGVIYTDSRRSRIDVSVDVSPMDTAS